MELSQWLYAPIYMYSVVILTLIYLSTIKTDVAAIIKGNKTALLALLLALAYTWFLGTRPGGVAFGDSYLYRHLFYIVNSGQVTGGMEEEGVYRWLMLFCGKFTDHRGFFLVCEAIYIIPMWMACRRLMPNNVLGALLFVIGAFSFYGYAVNGIRNGMATSLMLLAFTYIFGKKRDFIIGIVISIVAINIHRTAALPLGMALLSKFAIRDFRWAYMFWIASIVISLVAGGAVTGIFEAMGFDDRMTKYASNNTAMDMSQFSHTGFRWDFLLYSAMPIVLGYFVVIKQGVRDKTYMMLLNTYTLANAFWVMVIRAAFSNRFAYLSWFMYPIVLAYPLFRLEIWKNQGTVLRWVMFGNVAFNFIMYLIG